MLELDGAGLLTLVSEATAADLDAGSRSASIMFAGIPCLLYRTGQMTARLHVERPLATYVWHWLERRACSSKIERLPQRQSFLDAQIEIGLDMVDVVQHQRGWRARHRRRSSASDDLQCSLWPQLEAPERP